MHSTVMKNLHTHLLPVLALASLLVEISESASLHPVLTGPDLAYLSSRVVFRCSAPDSPPPVTFELMIDGSFAVGSGTDDQGGQPVPFFLKVTAASEGSYHCRATAGQSTGVSNTIRLSVVIPPFLTTVISDPSPPVVYEGSNVGLNCTVTKGSHLHYTWFFNRTEITASTSPSIHLVGNNLELENVTPEHAGSYYCRAWSQVNDISRFSNSPEVEVTVKVFVSKPRISFYIFKEGDGYQGNISCWSTRGSPPVNFSLLLDNTEEASVMVTESLTAWFPVVMVPGLDMGEAQCRVRTEVQELTSEPVTLEVVPVGGDVRVEVEYLYRGNLQPTAAALSCEISSGTFPHISWLFNDAVLPPVSHRDPHTEPVLPHYAFTKNSQTLLLAKLGPEESGYYRCRARNSYEASGLWVESAAVFVNSKGIFMTTLEVITILFCCFLLLMLILGSVFIYSVFKKDQADVNISATQEGPDGLTLSEMMSQSTGRQDDTHDAHDQTIELTV